MHLEHLEAFGTGLWRNVLCKHVQAFTRMWRRLVHALEAFRALSRHIHHTCVMSHVEPFRDIYSATFKSIPKASTVQPPSPYLNLRFHTHTNRQTRRKQLCEACGTRAFGYLRTHNCSLTQKKLVFLDQKFFGV